MYEKHDMKTLATSTGLSNFLSYALCTAVCIHPKGWCISFAFLPSPFTAFGLLRRRCGTWHGFVHNRCMIKNIRFYNLLRCSARLYSLWNFCNPLKPSHFFPILFLQIIWSLLTKLVTSTSFPMLPFVPFVTISTQFLLLLLLSYIHCPSTFKIPSWNFSATTVIFCNFSAPTVIFSEAVSVALLAASATFVQHHLLLKLQAICTLPKVPRYSFFFTVRSTICFYFSSNKPLKFLWSLLLSEHLQLDIFSTSYISCCNTRNCLKNFILPNYFFFPSALEAYLTVPYMQTLLLLLLALYFWIQFAYLNTSFSTFFRWFTKAP